MLLKIQRLRPFLIMLLKIQRPRPPLTMVLKKEQPRLSLMMVPKIERLRPFLIMVLKIQRPRPPLTMVLKVLGAEILPLVIDSQLLHCFFRNAMSNACKFGLRGGEVVARVSYDRAVSELTLEVTNQAGPDHQVLRALSLQEATDLVFPHEWQLTRYRSEERRSALVAIRATRN